MIQNRKQNRYVNFRKDKNTLISRTNEKLNKYKKKLTPNYRSMNPFPITSFLKK